jgi:hypothetical protein
MRFSRFRVEVPESVSTGSRTSFFLFVSVNCQSGSIESTCRVQRYRTAHDLGKYRGRR